MLRAQARDEQQRVRVGVYDRQECVGRAWGTGLVTHTQRLPREALWRHLLPVTIRKVDVS